jgi:hypothetical protein
MSLPHWLYPNPVTGELSADAREELAALRAWREWFRDVPAHHPGLAMLCAVAEHIQELPVEGKQNLLAKCGSANLLCYMLGRVKLSWELDEYDAEQRECKMST